MGIGEDKTETVNRKTDTSINIIGSIPDYNMIFYVLGLLTDSTPSETIHDIIVVKNKFGLRTEESRGRFLRVIKRAFWQFKNNDHETLIRSLFKTEDFYNTKNLSLFWMMGINDTLFENITKLAFLKAYFSGRVQIRNHEIIAYIRHERETSPDIQKWSDYTVEKVASKYLTFLKKTGFLEGKQKKVFKYIQVDNRSLLFFIYLIKAIEPNQTDILQSRYIEYLFIEEKRDLINTLKKAFFTDYFHIHSTGMSLKVDLKFGYEEIIDVISSRA